MTVRSAPPGSETPAWRIIFNAVGGKKTLRTFCSSTRRADHSGSNAPRAAPTTGRPWKSVDRRELIRPPIQAQSAGVQKRSPSCGKKSWEREKPG
jgi:hypothetical protein